MLEWLSARLLAKYQNAVNDRIQGKLEVVKVVVQPRVFNPSQIEIGNIVVNHIPRYISSAQNNAPRSSDLLAIRWLRPNATLFRFMATSLSIVTVETIGAR